MGRKLQKSNKDKTTQADRACIYELYEKSVQGVEEEVEFLKETFAKMRDFKPRLLREDFCGSAALAAEWVKIDHDHAAIGVDFDGDVLRWGQERHVKALPAEQQLKVQLIEGDVLSSETEPADITVAFNFSYWVFKTRDQLRDYFRAALASIQPNGLFMLDCFGGSEAYEEEKEVTKLKKFTYIWDQEYFDPVTADYRCNINFKFPDGSRIEPAFTYEWRLWTLPEIRELLLEAGFSRVSVFWEENDEDGEGTGEYQAVEHGEADPAWIAYIVAEKN